MSQSPPSTIGKYQIIREIARSNDIVYEGFDPLMNRRVAVKELSVPTGATTQQKEDRLKRFHREARAAGSLTHPNIVTTYEVFERDGRHCIAMEYLDGRNLRQELDATGIIPQERALEIATKILSGLSFAHKNSVVHRDIKPDNIQLLDNGGVKITDFGIARLAFEPNITMDGQVFGTPSYMSPEQINGKEIDARSDVFSVGVILYEMLAGKKPFPGDSVVSITYAIMNKDPEPATTIPGGIWEVIRRAVSKTPVERFGSAEEMVSALQSAVHSPAAQQPAPTQQAPPVMPGPGQQPQAPQQQANLTPYSPPQPYQMGMPPQPGSQPNLQPYTPPSMPGGLPNQVPVYYPPPPKKKLIKPETVKRAARFLFIGGIAVAIPFLIYWVILSLSDSAANSREQREARTRAERFAGPNASAGEIDQAAEIELAHSKLEQSLKELGNALAESRWREANVHWQRAQDADPSNTDSVNRQAASAYISLGRQLRDSGNVALARKAGYQASGFAKAAGSDELSAQAQAIIDS